MTTSFRLPDLGEGVHEAEILAIPVAVDQDVIEGDIIFEIETDKAAVEIPSPYTGVVTDILVNIGDLAVVGDILIQFSLSAAPTNTKRVNETDNTLQDSPVKSSAQQMEKRRPVPASPSTRRLARELDVDLYHITPSGSGGVVTQDDVLSFASRDTAPVKPAPADSSATVARTGADTVVLPDFNLWGPTERMPFRSIRRATAAHITQSWRTIPHVYCQDDVDITMLEAFRLKHKDAIQTAGGRLTLTVFALKAVATALKNYPFFNASLDLESEEIIVKHYFHIGIAVDSPKGLMVPVIRDVDRKSIKELSTEVHDSITRVRTQKQTREEMQGGTFTITNAGAIGGSRFSAIINHPEVAILGLGQGRMQPTVITNDRNRHEIVPRLIMPVVLCFDHRVVDGGDAIRFLRTIIQSLEDPDELLITMI